MTTFNDKEKAAENKYAHDQEIAFKIHARRDKLFGLYIAEKLGLTDAKAEDYAQAVVSEDWNKTGDTDIIARVKADLADKDVTVSDHDLRALLHQAHEQAKLQVKGG